MSDEQNPVAWLNKDGVIVGHDEGGTAKPLYLHPAPDVTNALLMGFPPLVLGTWDTTLSKRETLLCKQHSQKRKRQVMTLTKLFADSLEIILNHYKFSKPPLEARIVVLEEMIEQLCIEIDDLNQRNHNDGK